MKKLIALALFATPLVLAADAQAGIFDWFCPRQCPPSPCPPAATASVQGTTSYSATYQPAGASQRASSTRTRADEIVEMQRKIKGYGR